MANTSIAGTFWRNANSSNDSRNAGSCRSDNLPSSPSTQRVRVAILALTRNLRTLQPHNLTARADLDRRPMILLITVLSLSDTYSSYPMRGCSLLFPANVQWHHK